MSTLQSEFEQFLQESENKLEYLMKLGENCKYLRIESTKEKVSDYTESRELLYEYDIEISRNNLRSYISLAESLDKGERKVEVILANQDSFPMDANEVEIRFNAFGFAERLFLDVEYASYYLKVVVQEFNVYHSLKQTYKKEPAS